MAVEGKIAYSIQSEENLKKYGIKIQSQRTNRNKK